MEDVLNRFPFGKTFLIETSILTCKYFSKDLLGARRVQKTYCQPFLTVGVFVEDHFGGCPCVCLSVAALLEVICSFVDLSLTTERCRDQGCFNWELRENTSGSPQ